MEYIVAMFYLKYILGVIYFFVEKLFMFYYLLKFLICKTEFHSTLINY